MATAIPGSSAYRLGVWYCGKCNSMLFRDPAEHLDALFCANCLAEEEPNDPVTTKAREPSPGGDDHYTRGAIEPIDFIASQGLDFLAGNVIKYVTRHRHKGRPLEDLQKARWYLDRLIEDEENAEK